jgi:hypothetical protein
MTALLRLRARYLRAPLVAVLVRSRVEHVFTKPIFQTVISRVRFAVGDALLHAEAGCGTVLGEQLLLRACSCTQRQRSAATPKKA